MTDIVERLRKPIAAWEAEPPPICLEAADEIERLRIDRDDAIKRANALVENLHILSTSNGTRPIHGKQ